MTSVFPSGLDNFNNPSSTDNLNTPGVLHSDQHANANDAIEAIENWVGISGTSATASHEYRIKALENTPPGGGVFGFIGQDEGIFVGTGTVLNVVGNDVSLSISGTILELRHTNPPITFPQPVLGLMGHDEGIPLGTGTTLNIVGSRLSLSLSGTTLQLVLSPDPIDNIGIFGRSNGISLGTGAVIDFGLGMNASITGTTLFVHPFAGGTNGDAWVRVTGSAQGTAWVNQDYNIQFHLGDGSNVVSTGSLSVGYGYVEVPVDSIVESWTILGDATGSIVSNIYKSTYAGFPPISLLAGLGQPLMSNLRKNTGNATGTVNIGKGDVLLMEVTSVSTLKLVTISLQCRKNAVS